MSSSEEGEEDGYGVRADEAALEAARLAHLATARDPKTIEMLQRTGIGPGWHCLEVGAGAGTISAWLADRVGPNGSVLSTDIDTSFHGAPAANTEVRQHDIVADDLATARFDLVHTRAVLQHIPERDLALDRMVGALKTGGWMVIEDASFKGFGDQPVPADYQDIHQLMAAGATTEWRDADYGLRMLAALRDRGFNQLDVVGDVWAMRPGEPGGEWWFLAIERAGVRMVELGVLTQEQVDAAVAAVRRPGFVMMSSLSLSVIGQKP